MSVGGTEPAAGPQVLVPGAAEEPVTLGLLAERATTLDPRTPLSDSPLRSGAVVTVSRPGELYRDLEPRAVAVDERQHRAPPGQLEGQGRPDATGRPGEHARPPGEGEVTCGVSPITHRSIIGLRSINSGS